MVEDYKIQTEAVVGNHVTKSNIPPRRVWDLYTNRVLPYHAMGFALDSAPRLPTNLWAVSHSWRPASERQHVLTTINGKAWHVPIPKGTTLNTIRDELLILGAEYVFLDVLCLRQKDELLPEMEGIRKREWRVDIPTIGHVYNGRKHYDLSSQTPIVIFFNGLGLPFRDDPVDPHDDFHWFNRVWTLQETPQVTVFGGLQHKQGSMYPSADMQVDGISGATLKRLHETRSIGGNLLAIFKTILSRTC